MRLLKADTLEMKEHVTQVPPYAILSHTWGEEEVTFHDLPLTAAESKMKGYRKIQGCATLALSQGYEWIWVDTCCIDKTSSAELSEAINSMFRWYCKAAVCYAYLADVHDMTDEVLYDFYHAGGGNATVKARAPFQQSRWFTRGWTLQELIAPRQLEFYSAEWKSIGTKAGLDALLSEWTRIPTAVLRGGALSDWPASVKMSWMRGRQTTRKEDEAYCLFGIFDVHMPLLYGEGTRAFIRLQEEILRRSEDLSLLAWTNRFARSPDGWIGVLAEGPWAFSQEPNGFQICAPEGIDGNGTCANFSFSQPTYQMDIQQRFPPPAVTSRGILVTLLMAPIIERGRNPTSPAPSPPPEPSVFAWLQAVQTLEVGQSTGPDGTLPRKSYMIGLSLGFPHSTDRSCSLHSVLREEDKPLVASRSDSETLLLLDADYTESLVPRQVYLTATHEESFPNDDEEYEMLDWLGPEILATVGRDSSDLHDSWVKPYPLADAREPWLSLHKTDLTAPAAEFNSNLEKVNARGFSSVGVVSLRVRCRSRVTQCRAELSDIAVGLAKLSPNYGSGSASLFVATQKWSWDRVQTDDDIHTAYPREDGSRYADRAYVRLECGHLAVLTARWHEGAPGDEGFTRQYHHAVLKISFL